MNSTSPGETFASSAYLCQDILGVQPLNLEFLRPLDNWALVDGVVFDQVRPMPLDYAREDRHTLDFQKAQRRLRQLLEPRWVDLNGLQSGAPVDKLQEVKEGWRCDEMNHLLPRIQLGDLIPGADYMYLHGGRHTSQVTYPAALASSELANQISFSGRIFSDICFRRVRACRPSSKSLTEPHAYQYRVVIACLIRKLRVYMRYISLEARPIDFLAY